jgi:hypothetical protein
MKIISFNVGTTHLMHFNQKIIHPTGETVQNKNNRAKLIKFNILSSVNNENADILCIQEGFNEVLPPKYSNLTKINFYEVKHGFIGGYNSSFLATYVNPEKFMFNEDNNFDREYKENYGNHPCRTQIFILTEINTNKNTVLVNFHGVGSPDTSIRIILLRFLSNYLKRVYNNNDVVIVGDINTNLRIRNGNQDEIVFARVLRNVFFNDFDIFPKDDKKKSSYHRFIREDDNSFTDKLPQFRYDCLDYCLVKKDMKKEVIVKRIPKNFIGKEVPYKLDINNTIKPNFDEFPSDHTLNIYNIKNKKNSSMSKVRRIKSKQSKKARSTSNSRKSSRNSKRKTKSRRVSF